jgi:hypothetical protein
MNLFSRLQTVTDRSGTQSAQRKELKHNGSIRLMRHTILIRTKEKRHVMVAADARRPLVCTCLCLAETAQQVVSKQNLRKFQYSVFHAWLFLIYNASFAHGVRRGSRLFPFVRY